MNKFATGVNVPVDFNNLMNNINLVLTTIKDMACQTYLAMRNIHVHCSSARHSQLSDSPGQVDQGAGQRNLIDHLPVDRQLPACRQMAKIASDNCYHVEGNTRIAATCPADMCGISGMSCAVWCKFIYQ